jgi:NAD(P)-dependent dehydrogenase (short-subunit alcohol dehydrogenase family)
MLLKDKVVVVSGVGPGLGREIARACAREGADLVLGARTATFLDEVAAEVSAGGRQAVTVPTDITKVDQCAALIAGAVDAFGRVDCLVNSAFRPDVFRTFEDVDLDIWRKIFEVNVFGSLQLTKAALPQMKAQGGGSIVFINSMVMRKVLPLQGGYASSKGALLTAARVLAKELGVYRIRVNSVVPGWMLGPPVEGYLHIMASANGTTRDEEYAKIAADIPLGLIPPDEDCANAVVFFASDLSAVITGQSLHVNGGEIMH